MCIFTDAPYAGARIETNTMPARDARAQGMPPMRGRELKPLETVEKLNAIIDAPYAGARIETAQIMAGEVDADDAPYAGARIETFLSARSILQGLGCPLCGGEN